MLKDHQAVALVALEVENKQAERKSWVHQLKAQNTQGFAKQKYL